MCFGFSRNFSTYMAPLPNAESASADARASASANSDAWRTTRMPLPPPPPTAFSASGYPVSLAIASISETSSSAVSLPGITGTPASFIATRARSLSPAFAIESAEGPMNVSPASVTARAKSAFSERKP